MLKKVMVSLIVLVVGLSAIHACIGPKNVFGVRFNDQESIDVSVIEQLGCIGVNYLKEEGSGPLTYSFRSHFNPSIMVKIIPRGDYVAGDLQFTIDTSKINLTGFPFDSCARIELDWLVSVGVIEITRIEREKIEQDYARWIQQQGWHEGVYYWTKQDTLIPNSWIITPEGIIAMADGCGSSDAVVLPPQGLEKKTGVIAQNPKFCQTIQNGARKNNSAITFFDVRGRAFCRQAGGRAINPLGILLRQDRNSGSIERIISLP